MDDPATLLPLLLGAAWLVPLASFVVIVFFGKHMGPHGKYAGYLAVGAIVTSAVLSFTAMFGVWLWEHPLRPVVHDGAAHNEAAEPAAEGEASHDETASRLPGVTLAALQESPTAESEEAAHADAEHAASAEDHGGEAHAVIAPVEPVVGEWYTLFKFGALKVSIGYYIDSLTVTMFCMITLIASCIHFYALGYMHDELHTPYVDHEVTLSDGHHLHRPGRFCRFFQYFSLFCFSMLGIVIAGNVAMVFCFWELVGICSYFLIGFYYERHSASTAANKAFIVNRVGDFGMLIGIMALWASVGTLAFGDLKDSHGAVVERGLFSQLRAEENGHRLAPPEAMSADEGRMRGPARGDEERGPMGHWLLFVAGVGIFCGCVGKSAQFPLHVWLPDAMEGPTPVSALVHSATMVAAGVYLVGRFYPAFSPEVLLVIAVVGCITLMLAATIAITAVDIKRVLAYSTVSQLGYMMLALGLGGWIAGLLHLITHAFFKSLLFLCSGSVIHAVHTNDMRLMGGLRKKMPITAYTMLVGCLAIIGAGIPLTVIGLSGYYSKDAIIEQAWSHAGVNKGAMWTLVALPVIGAAMTAFYMFRLWFMTFAGEPRDHHRYDHAHESPPVMTRPLLVLAFFAIAVAWTAPFGNFSVRGLLQQAQPAGTEATAQGFLMPTLTVPAEELSHAQEIKVRAGLAAFGAAMAGLAVATIIYLWRMLNPAEIAQTFQPIYKLLWNKWYFDELYWAVFVAPTMFFARQIAWFDRNVIDSIINGLAALTRGSARAIEAILDQRLVDGSFNAFANWTWDFGLLLRKLQTGNLRQYVLFIVMGTWFMCLAYFAVSYVLS